MSPNAFLLWTTMRTTQALMSKSAGKLLGGSVLACLMLAAPAARAALSFNFTFQGSFTAAQQQAIVDSGALFSSMFATHFSNTAALDFTVNSVNDGLASAGSDGIDAAGFGNGEVVRNKIVNGVDLNGSGADGSININWATNFQLNPNAPVDFANGQIDLYSVLDHELTHAFGFGSNINAAGDTPGAYSKWDQFLTTQAGVSVVDPITGLVNHAAYLDAQINGGLFKGPNANAAYAGGVPLVKSDDISHLDTHAFSSPQVPQNALMLCCGGEDVQFEPRDYNSAEVGILADLGYTLAPVPEPATCALMLAGLGVLGFAAKRRHR